MSREPVSARLPDFPWDSLSGALERATAHPDGIIDLSIGTPVDSTPDVARDALAAASDAPGYPTTTGLPELRQAVVDWMARRLGVTGVGEQQVLPAVGSKELIGGLALHLGLGPDDHVVLPRLAYPTYAVGAQLAGAEWVADDEPDLEPDGRRYQDPPALVWINSPANPHGRVLSPGRLRALVRWAREHGVLLVSDECYVELGWDVAPTSLLHPDVCGGSHDGLLVVHSLSKRSNLAGYRGAFVVGDGAVVAELLDVRRNLGLMMPAPQQAACVAVLADDAHVDAQRARYADRRERLRAALLGAGFAIDHSEGGLYLWATRDEPCRETVAWLAERGILVAPGDFYGEDGARHVRVALTATDERVAAAVERLS